MMKWLKTMTKTNVNARKKVQRMVAEDLIKQIITHLLDNIQGGHHSIPPDKPGQITGEDVVEVACKYYNDEIEDIDEDLFVEQITRVLNSEWCARQYQEHARLARQE